MGRREPSPLIPAAHSPAFSRVFAWYTRRLLSRSFHAVRIDRASLPALQDASADPRPLLLVLNHASWWDPLLAFAIGSKSFPGRIGIAPIDAEQLQKFAFFRKIGLFGINPDDPSSLSLMLDYAHDFTRTNPHAIIAITPQGRFTDPREHVRIRPGAAAIAARLAPNIRALALSVEYAFWQSKRPEIFLRAETVTPPTAHSTPSWHRTIESTMQRSAAALSRLVIARDESAFTPLLESSAAAVNPAYDLWLKLRGKQPTIAARRSQPSQTAQGSGSTA
jgi:1-acyl-sn-glycerol-3-phosphate acyltransferase